LQKVTVFLVRNPDFFTLASSHCDDDDDDDDDIGLFALLSIVAVLKLSAHWRLLSSIILQVRISSEKTCCFPLISLLVL
jgi:hypothetical protein